MRRLGQRRFAPVSMVELSDQRTPAFILQLSSIVQATVDIAVAENALNITRLMPQASWDRIGRYARVAEANGAGAWLGIHFGLWKSHGATPLWMLFPATGFGHAEDVRRLIEPWAAKNHTLTTTSNHDFAIALDIPAGEEKAGVISSLVDQLKMIASVLAPLSITATADPGHEEDVVISS